MSLTFSTRETSSHF